MFSLQLPQCGLVGHGCQSSEKNLITHFSFSFALLTNCDIGLQRGSRYFYPISVPSCRTAGFGVACVFHGCNIAPGCELSLHSPACLTRNARSSSVTAVASQTVHRGVDGWVLP